MKKKLLKLVIVFGLIIFSSVRLSAQDAQLGEIKMVGFNFAPRGWADCNGQLLPISQNPALFSLLGTMYGGDGRKTFALPDLRGSIPVGINNVSGKDAVKQGQKINKESSTAAESKDKSSQGNNVQTYVGMRYIICVSGVFPSRS